MNHPQRARWSITLVFFMHGFLGGTWVTRIPDLMKKLSLSEAELGYLLLGSSLGVILTISIAGELIRHHSAYRLIGIGTLMTCLMLIFLAISPSYLLDWFLLFIFGASVVVANAKANAQSVDIEKLYNQPIIVSFHAFFSIGGFFGALFGGIVIYHQWSMLTHFLVISFGINAMMIILSPYFLDQASTDKEESLNNMHDNSTDDKKSRFSLPPLALIPLGLIGFISSIGEGIVSDWSALLLLEKLPILAYQATWGYAYFSLSMTTGRLIGDKISNYLPKTKLLYLSSILASFGFMLVVFAQTMTITLLGFILTGLGLSVVFPIVFSLAGSKEGFETEIAIASVSSIGYLGFLIGPPAIGFMSELVSISFAFFIAGLLMLSIVLLVRYAQYPELNRQTKVQSNRIHGSIS